MGLLLSILFKLRCMLLRVAPSREFPPPLGSEEEKECIEKVMKGDREARKTLIAHNLRLVSHIVKKYYSQSKNQEDLTSIGTIGLIKGVDSFSNDNGVRFATYASKCIQNEILMYFRSRKKLGMEVSLDDTIDVDKDGNPLTYLDVICEEDNIAEELDMKISCEMAAKIIAKYLTEREREIIIKRYGLACEPPLTQKELAKKLGISRSYVSRIEKAALEKIKYRMTR